MLLNRLLNFRSVVATAHFVNNFPNISTKFYSISSNTMEQENKAAIAGESTQSADDINASKQTANEFEAATVVGDSNIRTEDDANSNKQQSANENLKLGQLKQPTAESKFIKSGQFDDYVKLYSKALYINWPNGQKQRLEVWMGKEQIGHKFIKIQNKNLLNGSIAVFPDIPVPEDAYSIVQAMDELLVSLNSNQKMFNFRQDNNRSRKLNIKGFKLDYNLQAGWFNDQFGFQMEYIYHGSINSKKLMFVPINALTWLRNVFAAFLQKHDGSQKLNQIPNYPQELKQRYLFRQPSSPSPNAFFQQRSQQQSQNRQPSQISQPKPMNQQSGQQKGDDNQQQHILQALNQIAQQQSQMGDVHSKLAMTQQQISSMYNCIMQMQNLMAYQQTSNQFGQQIQNPQQFLQPITQQPQSQPIAQQPQSQPITQQPQPYVDNTNQALISLISQLITQQGQQQQEQKKQEQKIEQKQSSPPKVFYDFSEGQQKPKYKSQREQFHQYQRSQHPLQQKFTFFEEEQKQEEKAKTTTNLEEEDQEKPKIESMGDMFLDGRLEAAGK